MREQRIRQHRDGSRVRPEDLAVQTGADGEAKRSENLGRGQMMDLEVSGSPEQR